MKKKKQKRGRIRFEALLRAAVQSGDKTQVLALKQEYPGLFNEVIKKAQKHSERVTH